MARNNCCRICGNLDYDDDGVYLICTKCGERRRKNQFPWKETLLSVLMSFVSIFFLVCAFVSGKYIPKNGNLYYSGKENIMTGRNDFDDFMHSIRNALPWITVVFWILTVASVILTAKMISKLYSPDKMYKL